ncbi:von Willebrand factor type A domain-containing protein [Oleiphilus messinensis]|uniref:von Willebrand factor type A domain-containing protein n=1 Tax=Oleiphilus messinensis TaxID=141451 RepID=A0A1Y0I2J3_9GAMM|nr:vWA domain-containing protein [Oleiphilus messinensis]ARU54621.1 von Willebrand factor type A domain-containing protein [Oleiphilus messinensis]
MKNTFLALSLCLATAGAVAVYPELTVNPEMPVTKVPLAAVAEEKPRIEVVFVLDTTSSMSGLIQAAKENIWSIATTMASAQPAPEIHMGLVAFRDRGDRYVTKVIDMSTDLDSMYAQLMDLRAEGGGDTPESVNQGLLAAVNEISWSGDLKYQSGAQMQNGKLQNDKLPNEKARHDSYKVIFLVGDAPPHMDYPGEPQYPDILKMAQKKGIVINTIQAGQDTSTKQVWQDIAQLNQGSYFQVAQGGNAVAVSTPFDERIAQLSKDLDETRVFYGDAAKRELLEAKQAAADKLHALGSVASRAKRALFNASGSGEANFLAESELVDDVVSGRVELEALPAASLPEPLQKLAPTEQKKLLKEKAERRAELKQDIARLSRERQAYITRHLDKSEEADSLDYQIFDTVKAQAAEKGFLYDEAPAY